MKLPKTYLEEYTKIGICCLGKSDEIFRDNSYTDSCGHFSCPNLVEILHLGINFSIT